MSLMRERSYYLLTLGCPKNEVDSDFLETRLAEGGWAKTEAPLEASVLIVNTCAFITPALKESIDEILELAEVKAETGARLAVAGCMVARYGKGKLEKLLPEADLFVTFDAYGKVASALDGTTENDAGGTPSSVEAARTHSATLDRGFVYVKIAEGCERRCTFCAIPDIRGRLRSRLMEDVVGEAETFVRRGAREVVLVAQDTTRYGMDIYGKPSLPALLGRMAEMEGDFRVRVMYTHPEGVGDDLLKAMESHRICKYLDLPFQHADPEVLRAMGRNGDASSHLALLERARERLGEVAVRSTLMVGFPGEDRKAYAALRRFVEEARFDWLALFGYSREEGTPAFSLQKGVKEPTIRARLRDLAEIQDGIMREKAAEMVGRDVEVIIEGKSLEAPGFWEARSWREAPEVDGVVFVRDEPGIAPGTRRKVRIVSTEGIDLHGAVVE